MHFGVIRANQPLALFKSPAITRLLATHCLSPQLVDAFIVDARSHLRVPRCTRLASSQDNATFVFEASNGAAEYHLYYQPFTTCEYSSGNCEFEALTDCGDGAVPSRASCNA